MRWATTAGDDWEIALARFDMAMAARTLGELSELVDQATSRLAAVGNLMDLACVLASAAYTPLLLGGDRYATELLDRAEPMIQALADSDMPMIARCNRGLAWLFSGETSAARHAFREELELCRELAFRPIAQEGLEGLAAVATIEGDLQRAALLVGAADGHRYGQPDNPVPARLHASFLQDARGRYDARSWDAAAHSGSTLSLEDAISCALGDSRDGPDA